MVAKTNFVQATIVKFAMGDKRFVRLSLAFFWGGVAFLGWAPWGWWPALLLAMAALYQLVSVERRSQDAGALGMCFGLTMQVGLYATVSPALIDHMGSTQLSAVVFNLFVLLGMALFTALPCVLYTLLLARSKWVNSDGWCRAALFASLWVLGEFLRALFFPRMSFLSSGYALIDTWWAGFAPVVGSYGVGWLGVLTATLWMNAWTYTNKVHALAHKKCWLVLLLVLTGFGLQQQSWVDTAQTSFHARLIQADVVSASSVNAISSDAEVKKLVDQVTAVPTDLVITSETAFPMYWHEMPAVLIERLKTFANVTNSYLMLGAPTMNDRFKGSNSLVFVKPHQYMVETYNKVHLFPLGEYVPFGLGWLAARLPAPGNDLIRGGHDQKPFQIFKNGTVLNVGSVVCNEILLSDVSRKWAPDAHILINPVNTSWFWQGVLAPQVLQIARMRALEVGRPILHISQTGGSAHISASGQVVNLLPAGQTDILNVQFVGALGVTPYVWVGDWPILLLCALILLRALYGVRQGRLRLALSKSART